MGRQWSELTGEIVLDLINRLSGITFEELQAEVARIGGPFAAGGMGLFNLLYALTGLELIVAEGMTCEETRIALADLFYKLPSDENKPSSRSAVLRVTPSYVMARTGMELHQLGPQRPQNDFSALVFPIFGTPKVKEPSDVFVALEFSERCNLIYTDHIKKVTEALNLTIVRADEMLSSNAVIQDVWTGIYGSAVIVADCTESNPNVFYEIGIAHAIGRPVVLLLEKGARMPFDLNHIRYVEYEYTPRGMRAFEKSLFRSLANTLGMDRMFEWQSIERQFIESKE